MQAEILSTQPGQPTETASPAPTDGRQSTTESAPRQTVRPEDTFEPAGKGKAHGVVRELGTGHYKPHAEAVLMAKFGHLLESSDKVDAEVDDEVEEGGGGDGDEQETDDTAVTGSPNDAVANAPAAEPVTDSATDPVAESTVAESEDTGGFDGATSDLVGEGEQTPDTGGDADADPSPALSEGRSISIGTIIADSVIFNTYFSGVAAPSDFDLLA